MIIFEFFYNHNYFRKTLEITKIKEKYNLVLFNKIKIKK